MKKMILGKNMLKVKAISIIFLKWKIQFGYWILRAFIENYFKKLFYTQTILQAIVFISRIVNNISINNNFRYNIFELVILFIPAPNWSPGVCVPLPPSSEWGTLALGHILTYSGLANVAGVSLNFRLLSEHSCNS